MVLRLSLLALVAGSAGVAAFSPAVALRPISSAGLKFSGRDFGRNLASAGLRTGAVPGFRGGKAARILMSGTSSDKEGLGEGIDSWVDSSSAKAEMLEKAYELQIDCFTAENAKLINKKGEEVKGETLRGKSVALFFSCEWCPQCRDFMPYLKKFYEEQKGNIEIVFVSSDFTKEEAMASYKENHGDWLMLDYNSPLVDEYKTRHGVWAGKEASKYATTIAGFKNRKSGVPAIMVLMLDGEVCRFLPAEQQGLECLLMWDVDEVKWPK